MSELTIREAIDRYIGNIATDKKPRTVSAYKRVMSLFITTLQKQNIDVDSINTSRVFEGWIADFLADVQHLAPSTKQIYYSSVSGWYKFLADEGLAITNIEKLRQFAVPYLQDDDNHLPPQSPTLHDISCVISYIVKLSPTSTDNIRTSLVLLRDRAIGTYGTHIDKRLSIKLLSKQPHRA